MKLKVEILEKLKGNLGLRKQMLTVLDITRTTLWKYIDENDENLTRAAVLKLIADHYNQKPEDLLESEVNA